MRFASSLLAGALALASVQASAQDEPVGPAEEQAEADFSAFGDLFENLFAPAEPLSPEAEARLPAAQEVANALFPPDVFARVIEDTFGDMFSSFSGLLAPTQAGVVTKLTGVGAEELADIDEAALAEAASVLDPANEQRAKVEMQGLTTWIVEATRQAEPLYRDGYAKAFASRFTSEQLADLKAFFGTPTGAFFAAQFVSIGTDPQVKGKMQEVMPIMMAGLPEAMQTMQAAGSDLPPERYFHELTPAEQARLAELLGQPVEDLAAASAQARAEAELGDAEFDGMFGEDAESRRQNAD